MQQAAPEMQTQIPLQLPQMQRMPDASIMQMQMMQQMMQQMQTMQQS